jgi:hypothetical protein
VYLVLRRLRSAFVALTCAMLLILNTGSVLGATVDELIDKLKNGSDFRVRMQAALELGKTKSPAGRVPLENALDDDNAAVRTAAAAALKIVGDKQSLPALEKHKGDSSAAVKAQVEATIASLKSARAVTTTVIVKLGKMGSAKDIKPGKLLGDLEENTRQKFGELPGVKISDGSEDKKTPTVMITGHIRKLGESKDGDEIKISASVEYIVHKMPEQSIAGTVTGSASTKASPAEAKKRQQELRLMVLVAAVESAVRRAPEALAHATK